MKSMKKQKTPKQLKEKLWQLCREIALKSYSHNCYTCGAILTAGTSNMQLGHFIPSGSCGAFLRHDMRNLRWQCMRCNCNLGGNGAEFYKRMVKEIGQEQVDEIFRDKQRIIKADSLFYLQKIREYTEKLEGLK